MNSLLMISRKELKNYVVYSDQHLLRLEAAGVFPKRVKLGAYRGGRVCWVKDEVMAWLQQRLDARQSP